MKKSLFSCHTCLLVVLTSLGLWHSYAWVRRLWPACRLGPSISTWMLWEAAKSASSGHLLFPVLPSAQSVNSCKPIGKKLERGWRGGVVLRGEVPGLGKAATLKVHFMEWPAYPTFMIPNQSVWGSSKISAWQCLPVLILEGR